MINSIIAYLLIISGTTMCSYLAISRRLDKKLRNCFFIISVLIPSFFSGIRDKIGTDFNIYYKVFNEIASNSAITKRSEYGYVLLNKFVLFFTDNFYVFQFIVAFITIFCVFSSLYRKKDKINYTFAVLSFMLLFYQMSFNLSRQLLSAAIIIFSVKFLEEDKKYVFLLMGTVATLIHSVSVIALPLTFLYNFLTENRTSKYRRVFYVLVLMMVICYSYILTPIISHFQTLHYYLKYITYSFQGFGLGIFRYILLLLIPIFLVDETKKEKDIMIYFAISVLGFILWLNSYFSDYIAYRISYTFLLALPMVLGFYYKNIRSKYSILIRISLVIILVFFWYYDYFYLGSHGTVPYVSII